MKYDLFLAQNQKSTVIFITAISQKITKFFYLILLSKTGKSDYISPALLWDCCGISPCPRNRWHGDFFIH
jgi:hypothetical protein